MKLASLAAAGTAALLLGFLALTPGIAFGSGELAPPPEVVGHLAGHTGPELLCTPGAAPVKKVALVAEEAVWTFSAGPPVDAWTFNGTVPGPVLCANLGDTIEVSVRNALSVPVSFHTHLPQASTTPVAPGATETYRVTAATAGTFLYHDLANGNEGTARGLHGVLIVRNGTPDADHEIVMVLGEVNPELFPDTYATTLNGKAFPIAPTLRFASGERVLVHLVNVGPAEEHTFHVHGHRWLDVADGRAIDNKFLSPHTAVAHADLPGYEGVVPMTHALAPDTAVFFMKAEAPGMWMYHCHVYDHINAGMTGMLEVLTPSGASVGGLHHA